MHNEDPFIAALVHALERDASPRARRQAVNALRAERGVSASSAYAMLVRAVAGVPAQRVSRPEPVLTQVPVEVPLQRRPLLAS
jgi:hypothetical protein